LELQNDGYEIALVSNIGHEHKARIEDSRTFEKCIKFFSCDVGARKPTMLYYKTFLDMHPEFLGALYVDDLAENLAMGEKFGLKPIEFALDRLDKHAWSPMKAGYIQLRMKLRMATMKTPDIEPSKETE
jgi:FMN phosphatase YigB (HAD superfamily)